MISMRPGQRLALAIAVAIIGLGPFIGVACAFPDRPIKLMVPFPAGGATDTATRLVARGASSVLGQPILIENQGGAGGTIALKQVISAPADGYTIMSVGVSSTFVTQMILFNLDFDPAKLQMSGRPFPRHRDDQTYDIQIHGPRRQFQEGPHAQTSRWPVSPPRPTLTTRSTSRIFRSASRLIHRRWPRSLESHQS